MTRYTPKTQVNGWLQVMNLVSYNRMAETDEYDKPGETGSDKHSWVDSLIEQASYDPECSCYFTGPNGGKWYTPHQVAQLATLRAIQRDRSN